MSSRFETAFSAWGGDRQATQRAPKPSALIRTLDVVLATAILLFIFPLLIVLAIAVKCQDGGPAIFAHRRVGRDGKTFFCLKFRSMLVDAEARLARLLATDADARQEWDETQKLRSDPRITRFGAFLRRSSLDELPQLFNVLRGEMSLVGPRPIVQAEVARYGHRIRHYNAMRPGITGLWQVGGRSDTSYRRRVAFDTLYNRRRSPRLYLMILVKTVPSVLARHGSY